MPERAFLTETWDDDWFHGLSRDQRYLFIYLWTNGRCNQAGFYHINLATMAFETKFMEEELPQLLRSLSPKVEWYPEHNYVWVKNFIKWQAKSPKFLIAVARCLKNVRNNGLAREIINYNLKEHSISIPYEEGAGMVSIGYQYPIDTSLTPIPSMSGPNADTGNSTGKENRVRGRGKPPNRPAGAVIETAAESGSSETHEGKIGLATVTAEESALLEFLKSLEGWRFAEADDLIWLREFRQDWPDFSLLLAKACRDYHSGRMKPKHKGIWKKRFHVWMSHDRQFKEERSGKIGEREHHSRPVRAYEWDENPEGADFST